MKELFFIRRFRIFIIRLMLIAFVLGKASVPTGYMLGNGAEGEWLVLCSVNGVQSIFIADNIDTGAQENESSDSNHATKVGDICLISLNATLALLDASLPSDYFITNNSRMTLSDTMNGQSNWQTTRPIRAPPELFS